MNQIRKPAVAGLFYQSDADELKVQVQNLLNSCKPNKIPQNIYAIISPHAGYFYSGETAAYGFSSIKKSEFETVVIISPSHKEYFPGVCIYEGSFYETPLGTIPINKKLSDKIEDPINSIFKGLNGHKGEHAIEVQLPFLQCLLEDFSIVPIVMGDQGKVYIEALANKLADADDGKTLFIASSDLSHYYNSATCNEMDLLVEKGITNFNTEKLYNDFQNQKCEACGAGPILTVMRIGEILNKTNSIILDRTNSGKVSNDFDQVVGYISAILYGN